MLKSQAGQEKCVYSPKTQYRRHASKGRGQKRTVFGKIQQKEDIRSSQQYKHGKSFHSTPPDNFLVPLYRVSFFGSMQDPDSFIQLFIYEVTRAVENTPSPAVSGLQAPLSVIK